MEPVDLLFAKSILKPYKDVSQEAVDFLGTLFYESRQGSLCIVADEPPSLPESLFDQVLHREGNRFYLKRNWECQSLFLKSIDRIKNHVLEPIEVDSLDKALLPLQMEAIVRGLKFPLTLIYGGPGTGKSFVAAKLIEAFLDNTKGSVAALAPTGKAAANLRKGLKEVSTRVTIQTLHSILGSYSYLPFDLLIVDEASMIDARLFSRFLAAVKWGARVVILGDPYQLPPVEAGSLFSDLLQKEMDSSIELKMTLRAEKKELIELADRIKRGEECPILPLPSREALLRLIQERSCFSSFDTFQKFRVLTPLRQGPFGVEVLNAQLYAIFKQTQDCFPVMIMKNDSKLGVYNGDIGFLKGDEVIFEDGRKIQKFLLPPFEYAFVSSIHKSQGSEFDEVFVILPPGSENFGREMIYTAVTRARKKVILYGDSETVTKMLQKGTSRISGVN